MSDSKVEKLRIEGNEHFKRGKLDAAIEKYTEALAIDNKNPVILSNRAQCHLNKKHYFEAESDCSQALELEPNCMKAHYRRAVARKHLFRYPGALTDLKAVLKLDENNKKAKEELDYINNSINKDIKHVIQRVEKPERLRSKQQLIPLNICNLPSGKKTENEALAKAPTKLPQSYIEFDCCWRDIVGKNSSVVKFELLKNLREDLVEIFRSCGIEPELLTEIVEICRQRLSDDNQDCDIVRGIFESIQSASRFKISFLLLSPQDRKFFNQIKLTHDESSL